MTIEQKQTTTNIANSDDIKNAQGQTDPLALQPPVDDELAAKEALREKMTDPYTPGVAVEFDPSEAEQAGAFYEDALSEEDAAESNIDLAAIDREILDSFVSEDDFSDPVGLPPHVTTANARELFGWKPGETVGEAAMRAAKKG